MPTVQETRKIWLATRSWLTVWWRMPFLGLRWMPSLSSSGCLLPASLPPVGDGPVSSQLALLWCSLNLLFCEQALLCLRLELFTGKFYLSLSLSLFFSFPSLAIPQFGLLSQVSSLRSSSGHSGPVLPLSMQHALPCSAPTQCWQTRASGLLLCWELWLGMQSVCVCIFLLVMLPSEIPKPPTDPPVRGFPGVWELLLLHNSLSGMGLNP